MPARWQSLYYLNPLAASIEGLRWSLIGTPAPPAWAVGYAVTVAVIALVAGLLVFRRMERGFADVI